MTVNLYNIDVSISSMLGPTIYHHEIYFKQAFGVKIVLEKYMKKLANIYSWLLSNETDTKLFRICVISKKYNSYVWISKSTDTYEDKFYLRMI